MDIRQMKIKFIPQMKINGFLDSFIGGPRSSGKHKNLYNKKKGHVIFCKNARRLYGKENYERGAGPQPKFKGLV